MSPGDQQQINALRHLFERCVSIQFKLEEKVNQYWRKLSDNEVVELSFEIAMWRGEAREYDEKIRILQSYQNDGFDYCHEPKYEILKIISV